jgi:hypothetical protein
MANMTPGNGELYNLVSVLYHALGEARAYARYSQEAAQAGDHELARFFIDVSEGNKQRAERAKQLLARRLYGPAGEDVVELSSQASFPASDAPAHHTHI